MTPRVPAGIATSFVRHHHERMDGRGYPNGLPAGDLPLGSRITTVGDAFDAMADAPYREALPYEVVLDELRAERGRRWDTHVVDALLSLIDQGRVAFPDTTATPVLYDRGGQIVPLPTAV